MASPAVARQQQSGKMERVKAATLTWLEWKGAGKAPKTREAALRIISDKVGVDLSTVRESLARTMRAVGATDSKIDDRLSLCVWDITVNGSAMLDYNRAVDAILSDLLMQAADCIFLYTRARVSTSRVLAAQNAHVNKVLNTEAPQLKNSTTMSMASVVSLPGKGATLVSSMTKSQLEELAEGFVVFAVKSLLRWKALGADPAYIKRVLRRVEEEVLESL